MDSEIRQELADIKSHLAFLTDLLDSQTKEHLSNEEAQKLLGRSPDWFNQKIKAIVFIKGQWHEKTALNDLRTALRLAIKEWTIQDLNL